MRVVAAAHALWLCGTEKCPFDFATDGGSRRMLATDRVIRQRNSGAPQKMGQAVQCLGSWNCRVAVFVWLQ